MQLLQLFFVYIATESSFCAIAINKQQTNVESPQIDVGNHEDLIVNVPESTKPTGVDTSQPTAINPSQPMVADTPQPSPQTIASVGDCICVPYYQCDRSNTIIEDGAGLIDIRIDQIRLKARAGGWDVQTVNKIYPHQDRKIKAVIVHENYYDQALHNDIALLIMETPFEITENVDLICLPDEGEVMDGRECAASGWGKDIFGKQGKYQEIMKKVELPVISKPQCTEVLRKTRLGQHFKLHDSFICAGGEPGKDTCTGDGGSPLVCPSQNNSKVYRQAGIVAWGIQCGEAIPGVYVNVPLFRGWIISKLSSYNIDIDN